MATISFDEKVVVKNKRTSRRVIKQLDSEKPVTFKRYSNTPTSSLSETINNAKKWHLL